MGGGLGTQPASHHTREKISGGPTGQDFPAPSLPAPRPWGRKGRGSPLPPRGLGTQLLICVPGDRKRLEVPLQDGSLPGEGAVLPQSPTATVKSLRSHSISLVQSLSLPSAPGHPGQRLDPWENKERKSTSRWLQSFPGDFQFARKLQTLRVAPPFSLWFLNVCFPVTTDGMWVWGVASLKSGPVSSERLLWGTLRRQFSAPPDQS